jgi:hypothetical protein
MAHFAKLNIDNIVMDVIVAEQDFIDTLEDKDRYIQTSYNTWAGIHKLGGTPLRKNFAGIGFTYDKIRDAFIPPKRFPSWTLNETTCLWEPPTACPTDGTYNWDEETQTWIKVNISKS